MHIYIPVINSWPPVKAKHEILITRIIIPLKLWANNDCGLGSMRRRMRSSHLSSIATFITVGGLRMNGPGNLNTIHLHTLYLCQCSHSRGLRVGWVYSTHSEFGVTVG